MNIHAHDKCTLTRGIKFFKCFRCGKQGNNYSNGIEYCNECRNEFNICDICGEALDIDENNCKLPMLGLTTVYGIKEYYCGLIRNENCKRCMIRAMHLQDEYFKQFEGDE